MMKLWFKEANGLIRHSKSVTQSVSNPGLISETVLYTPHSSRLYIYISHLVMTGRKKTPGCHAIEKKDKM